MNFIFRGNDLLLSESGLSLPEDDVCTSMGLDGQMFHPIWPMQESRERAVHVAIDTTPPNGYAFHRLRGVLGVLGEKAASASRAFQVSEWARTHRYCGVCASPMNKSATELCFHCPACGFNAYPRVSPAMMVLIKRGKEILLARHTAHANARYTALAGFVEAGENIEEAIHREVFEEVGLYVKDLTYFGSQSWPFPHSLMIAYTAEYEGGKVSIQEDELVDARWFGPSDPVVDIPTTDSIAGRLIRANSPWS